jgi:uncharacterized protein YcaQ
MALSPNTFSRQDARRLLLLGQGLLTSPRVQSNADNVGNLVRALGFVQIDSINVLERAHHLTLGTRMDGYRESFLTQQVEQERSFFEGWTHDASIIPIEYYKYWHWRRLRFSERVKRRRPDSDRTPLFNSILERIRQEGALPTSAFRMKEHSPGKWWGWSPTKVALEYLWRTGILSISHRKNFQKYYDLPERVIPSVHLAQVSSREQTLTWSVRSALERLGSATSREIAHYWNIFPAPEVERWCLQNLTERAQLDGRRYWLRPDWREVLQRAPEPLRRLRLLCPFDPLIRDRKRLEFLFDFEYRFEAYVPAPKRAYGYYVLPILCGDKMVGRVNLKFDRKQNSLLILGLWWEQGERPKKRALESEIRRLAKRISASSIMFAKNSDH